MSKNDRIHRQLGRHLIDEERKVKEKAEQRERERKLKEPNKRKEKK